MTHQQLILLSALSQTAGVVGDPSLSAKMVACLENKWGSQEAARAAADELPHPTNDEFNELFLGLYAQAVAGGPVHLGEDAVSRWFDEWELALPADAREALRGLLKAQYERGQREGFDALVEEGERQAREE